MEARGAYNKHATIPVGGAALAVSFLEETKQTLDDQDHPVVIVDYGSSQGKNALAPMATAIQNLRRRLARHRPILVFHIDQPSNDFNSLFEVLSSDPDRFSPGPNVFPGAIGRSFYEAGASERWSASRVAFVRRNKSNPYTHRSGLASARR
jgi:hypothetical protein